MRLEALTNNELLDALKKHEDMLIDDPMLEYDETWLSTVEDLVRIMQEREIYNRFEESLIEDDVEDDFESYH